jgi:hypothetical protein
LRHPCRTPTPFTGNELKAVGLSTDEEGLDNAVCPNGIGEFLEAVGLKDGSRLERVRVDLSDWKFRDRRSLRGIGFEL